MLRLMESTGQKRQVKKKNGVHRGAGGVKPGFRESWRPGDLVSGQGAVGDIPEGRAGARESQGPLPTWVPVACPFHRGLSCPACPFSWGWKAESSPRWVGLVWLLSAKVNRSTSQPACQAWEQRREAGRTGEGSWCFPSPKAGT